MAKMPLVDPVSGFRAISRDAAFRIHVVSTYSYTLDSLLQAAHKRIAIQFIPIETNAPTRPSRLFRSVPQFVMRSTTTILRVFFLYHAFEVLSMVATALMAVGVVPILRFLLFWWAGDSRGHIQSLVIGTGLLILGAVVLLTGMLSDLIATNRILIEVTLECGSRRQCLKNGED